uniref:Alpha-MPP n=1 Tax=Rhodosorus marinus TaxID=101924 RepID=A0A7S0BD15_9RHOD|mmetsp:Transcript_11038/g.15911  ORF Transcript_11038/g.15911 Transcript_11038/m.15911 type:complete len:190 (+) Transcript_11038:76-645(+)
MDRMAFATSVVMHCGERSDPLRVSRRSMLKLVSSCGGVMLPCPLKIALADDDQIPEDIRSYASRVNSFTLPNGFKFVVLERGVSPTVSFVTYVDVGASDEIVGKTGIAHFLEHLAFKGTQKIGTKDYGREIALLNEIDDLTEQKKQISDNNRRKLSAIDEKILSATAQAEELVISNDFSRIVQQEYDNA